MGRPAQGYRLADGTRVPGTTTITGRFKDSGGLIFWAWEQGRDGKDFRETRDAAATAGTLGHEMIEAEIVGRPVVIPANVDPKLLELARGAFDSFKVWQEQTKIMIVATEEAMVSEAHRFGGTLDALGVGVDGELAILDWKTSNGIYADYLCQIAAYRALWHETHPDQKKIQRAHLLRVGKEFGDFHHHSWPGPVLDVAWEAFLHMRKLYDLDAQLKKAA